MNVYEELFFYQFPAKISEICLCYTKGNIFGKFISIIKSNSSQKVLKMTQQFHGKNLIFCFNQDNGKYQIILRTSQNKNYQIKLCFFKFC